MVTLSLLPWTLVLLLSQVVVSAPTNEAASHRSIHQLSDKPTAAAAAMDDSSPQVPLSHQQLQKQQQQQQQQAACFVIGSTPLPADTAQTVAAIQSSIICNTSVATIRGVPDVVVVPSGVSFSSVSFAASAQTPLEFALQRFAAANPLASSDLPLFRAHLAAYQATEAGVLSVDAGASAAAIRLPRSFLEFQISRIQAARGGAAAGNPSTATVSQLLGRVLSNAAGEDKDLLDKLTALSKVLV